MAIVKENKMPQMIVMKTGIAFWGKTGIEIIGTRDEIKILLESIQGELDNNESRGTCGVIEIKKRDGDVDMLIINTSGSSVSAIRPLKATFNNYLALFIVIASIVLIVMAIKA